MRLTAAAFVLLYLRLTVLGCCPSASALSRPTSACGRRSCHRPPPASCPVPLGLGAIPVQRAQAGSPRVGLKHLRPRGARSHRGNGRAERAACRASGDRGQRPARRLAVGVDRGYGGVAAIPAAGGRGMSVVKGRSPCSASTCAARCCRCRRAPTKAASTSWTCRYWWRLSRVRCAEAWGGVYLTHPVRLHAVFVAGCWAGARSLSTTIA